MSSSDSPANKRMQVGGKRENPPRGASLSGMKALPGMLHDADVLLIVPPFHRLEYSCLSVHLLQACARKAGVEVRILYASMLLASWIGEGAYTKICDAPEGSFAAERFFARCAFGLPALGRRARQMFEADWVIGPNKDWEIRPDLDCYECKEPITLQELRRLEGHAEGYVDAVARAVCERRYRIVGCSTSFKQTAASVALLNRIKALRKETITILGGANCEGEMARGIATLRSKVDYIFSGESDVSFPKFIRTILAGGRPRNRLICSEPCKDLDSLPPPAFQDFYEQRRLFLPRSRVPAGQTEILYEASRGCWWGQKRPCAFCGLNGESAVFRQKSSGRVIEDLHVLLRTHPTRHVTMTDKIMPHSYFRNLLPRLTREFPGVSIFYEQRADLSLVQLLALRKAGVRAIGPGIESLSSRLLTLMRKGVKARQNLMLLRNARAAGVDLDWFLLWGFPGDEVGAYEETLNILPLLRHLKPPTSLMHLSIDRFSPYFCEPAEFGVRRVKPLRGFYDFLPAWADVERIAYNFTADYPCGAHDHVEVIHRLWEEMAQWKAAWKQTGGAPTQDLQLFRKGGSYLLVDTRDLWRRRKSHSLGETEAWGLVTARPYSGSELEAWALDEKLAVIADDWFVPLAVAEPEILLHLMRSEERGKQSFNGLGQVG